MIGTIHSRLDPPMSIINQEKAPQTYLQACLTGAGGSFLTILLYGPSLCLVDKHLTSTES